MQLAALARQSEQFEEQFLEQAPLESHKAHPRGQHMQALRSEEKNVPLGHDYGFGTQYAFTAF
jgi:hypothetical protein